MRQLCRGQTDEGETVEDQRNDTQIEHTAEQKHTEGEKKHEGVVLSKMVGQQRAEYGDRLRGHGGDEPGAIATDFEARLILADHHRRKEGVHHHYPEENAERPEHFGGGDRTGDHHESAAHDTCRRHHGKEAQPAGMVLMSARTWGK